MKSSWLWLCLVCMWRPLLASLACPTPCSCSNGGVNCSSRVLTSSTLPASFPADSKEILLHDNQLVSLPNRLLDRLPALRRVSLHGNPWVCDCGLLYLRGWLLRQEDRSQYRNVTCSSPASLRGRLVMYLVEEEILNSCQYWYCDLALASQLCLLLLIVLQAVLLACLLFFLRRFQSLSQLGDAHDGSAPLKEPTS